MNCASLTRASYENIALKPQLTGLRGLLLGGRRGLPSKAPEQQDVSRNGVRMARTQTRLSFQCAALGGVAGSINVFQFDEGTRQRAQLEGGAHPSPMPPFFVIASNEVNRDMASQDPPVYWPERIYPWGVSQVWAGACLHCAMSVESQDTCHLCRAQAPASPV